MDYIKKQIKDIIFIIRSVLCMEQSGLEVIKLFLFMLNSVEHEILNAREYKDIKKFGLFRFR